MSYYNNYNQGSNYPYAQGPFNDPNGEPQESASHSYNKRSYRSASSKGGPLEFQIIRPLGVLQENTNSNWSRELNIVSWNNNAPKYDLRDWSPAHNKMSKGISLSLDEMVRLYEILHNEIMYLQSEAMNNNLNAGPINTAENSANTTTTAIAATVNNNSVTSPLTTMTPFMPPKEAPTTPMAPTAMPSLTTDPLALANTMQSTPAQSVAIKAVPTLPSNSTTVSNEQITQFNQPLDHADPTTGANPTEVAELYFEVNNLATTTDQG